jgi:hypothetical protein
VATTAACDLPAVAVAEPSKPPETSIAAPTTPTATTTPAAPATAYRAALDHLATLPVKAEDTGARYDRDAWKHWIGQSGYGRGCTTREMVIRQQGRNVDPAGVVGPVAFDPATCQSYVGRGNAWVSAYDGVVVTDPGQLDVDHWVPLEQMARSGTRAWTAEQRKQYANDPDVLIAVTANSNRRKGSQDPAKWMPDNPSDPNIGCEYVRRWTEIKYKWSTITSHPMTVDQAEHEVLSRKLTLCAR